MKIEKYKYLFPSQPSRLWDGSEVLESICKNSDYIAEYKKNGWQWNLVRFPDGKYEAWTRHGTKSTLKVEHYKKELDKLNWEGLCEVQVEVLDRRTTDIKQKLFFFDVKIWNSDVLVDKTFRERREILENLFSSISTKYDWFEKGHNMGGVLQLSKIFYSTETNFKELYKDAVNTKMDEGLVLKKLSGKLELKVSSTSNSSINFKWKKVEDHWKRGINGMQEL